MCRFKYVSFFILGGLKKFWTYKKMATENFFPPANPFRPGKKRQRKLRTIIRPKITESNNNKKKYQQAFRKYPPPLPTYSSRGVTSLERCHGHRIKIQGHRLRSGYKMAESFESVPRAWTHSLGLRKNMRGCWTCDQTFWREKKKKMARGDASGGGG